MIDKMDCPNCGAYNASSSFRCRRCGEVLPSDTEEGSSSEEWGPASGPSERWDEEPSQEREEQEETNPWAWREPEPAQEPEWSPGQFGGSSYSDPLPDESTDQVHSGAGYNPDVPNYLWPAIGVTICCCAPLGIPAIIYASRVDAFMRSNDRAAAEEASSKAKTWILAAAGVSLMIWIALLCTGVFTADSPA